MNAPYQELTPDEFRQMQSQGWDGMLLDVRTPEEYAAQAIAGSHFIPLQELPARMSELPKDKPIVIHCKAGMRSANACLFLAENGFSDLTNLEGGIDAW